MIKQRQKVDRLSVYYSDYLLRLVGIDIYVLGVEVALT